MPSTDLLTRLLSFYKKRYKDSLEMEKKFNNAVSELIKSGDIERSEYITFCIDNDVETIITKPSSSSSSSSSDPCGHGGGYARTGC